MREDVHSSGTPKTTVKNSALTEQKSQGSQLQVELTLAVRGLINDSDVHTCDML